MPWAMFSDSRKEDTRWSMSPASPAGRQGRQSRQAGRHVGLGRNAGGQGRGRDCQAWTQQQQQQQQQHSRNANGRVNQTGRGARRQAMARMRQWPPTTHPPTRSRPTPPTSVWPEGEGVEPPRLAHLVQSEQVGVHVECVIGKGCRQAQVAGAWQGCLVGGCHNDIGWDAGGCGLARGLAGTLAEAARLPTHLGCAWSSNRAGWACACWGAAPAWTRHQPGQSQTPGSNTSVGQSLAVYEFKNVCMHVGGRRPQCLCRPPMQGQYNSAARH